MASYKIPYPGLTESLKHLRVQVIHSLPYAVRNLPAFETPEQIFNYCKSRYTFKNDEPGIEQFMTVPTLLNNNIHNIPGAGDCDDATIFCLTMLLRSGFINCGIVLTGRSKLNASHIYAYVITDENRKQFLDLTNKKFNYEREYPFKQCIPFKISKNQLDMFLQLADGNFKRFLNKPKLRRVSQTEKDNGIYLPSKNVYIPIDTFDKLPIHKAKRTLLSEGYEVLQLSEYLSGRAERKARKAQKVANKQTKFETKQDKKRGKNENIHARAEIKSARASKKIDTGYSRRTKAEGKKIKAERGEESGGSKFFKKSGDFFNRIIQPDEEQPEAIDTDAEEVNPEEIDNQDFDNQEQEQQPEEELNEGFESLNKNDLIPGVLFLVGCFLEKTKKVA